MGLDNDYEGEYYIPRDFRKCFVGYFTIMGKGLYSRFIVEEIEHSCRVNGSLASNLDRDVFEVLRSKTGQNSDKYKKEMIQALRHCLKPRENLTFTEEVKLKMGLL